MLSLQKNGVVITKAALQQRVTRARSEFKDSDVLEEVNMTTSQSTAISSLTSVSTDSNNNEYGI